MSTLRKLLFGNLMRTLAVALGVMQAGIAHWFAVVIFQSQGIAAQASWMLAIALLLSLANVAAMPIVRRARRLREGKRGAGHRAATSYMAIGLATLLLGGAVAASWLVLWPLSALAGALVSDSVAGVTWFRAASGSAVGAVGLLVLWGFTLGQSRIRTPRIAISLERLSPRLGPIRIAHLSDLHIGNGLEGERLDALVANVNSEAPDLIAITGDVFDFDPSVVEDGMRGLANLQARLGVYMVLGNHDFYVGAELVAAAAAALAPNIKLLRGDLVRVCAEPPLFIAGVDDPGLSIAWTQREIHIAELEDLGNKLPDGVPAILLVHRPEAFPQAARLGFDLVLAGHTHGGQLALPLTSGRVNLARLISRFDAGHHASGGSQLFVSRGVGVAGPAIRIACDREIPLLEVRSTGMASAHVGS